jgi:hypothetical protein
MLSVRSLSCLQVNVICSIYISESEIQTRLDSLHNFNENGMQIFEALSRQKFWWERLNPNIETGSKVFFADVRSKRVLGIGGGGEGIIRTRDWKPGFWLFVGIVQTLLQIIGRNDTTIDTVMSRRCTYPDSKRMPAYFDLCDILPKCDSAGHWASRCHIVHRSLPPIFSLPLLHFYSPIFEMAQIGALSKIDRPLCMILSLGRMRKSTKSPFGLGGCLHEW